MDKSTNIDTQMKTQISTLFCCLLTAVTHVSAATLLLKDVNLIDTENRKMVKAQSVLIKDKTIIEVGDTAQVEALARQEQDVETMSFSGKYLIPGLIDGHVHHATVPEGYDNEKDTQIRLKALLEGGVTTVRDMGGDARVLAGLKRKAELDIIPSPDIYFSVIIGGPTFFADPRTVASARGRVAGHAYWMKSIQASDNVDEVILRAQGTGATGIKIYADVPANLVGPLAQAAKKYGMKVWSHAYVGPAKPSELAEAGVEVLSHTPDLSAEYVNHFKAFRRLNKTADAAEIKAANQEDNYLALWQQLKDKDVILDATLHVFEEHAQERKNGQLLYDFGINLTQWAYENGVKISVGTDAHNEIEGDLTPAIHHEMVLLVEQSKMQPMDVLQAATLHNAEVLGLEDKLGSVTAGKTANLVILNADPTKNIRATTDIHTVVKNGRVVKSF